MEVGGYVHGGSIRNVGSLRRLVDPQSDACQHSDGDEGEEGDAEKSDGSRHSRKRDSAKPVGVAGRQASCTPHPRGKHRRKQRRRQGRSTSIDRARKTRRTRQVKNDY